MFRVLAIALLFASGFAHAGGRDALVTFTHGLKGLDGQFRQDVYDSKGKRKESSSGRVALSAPKLFRWEYLKPNPQLIVVDGKQIWIYDPDLKHASVRPQGSEEENSPLMALIDPKRLDRDFKVRDLPAQGGLEWMELTPKSTAGASFQSARLGFDARGLARMHLVDALGQRTEIVFEQWRRNPRFASGTFRFTPPKDVDVVGAP